MSTDSPTNPQWPNQAQDSPQSYALSGRIMLASIIILFAVVVLLFILHLYARWYLLRLQLRRRTARRRRRSTRIIFYVDNNNNNQTLASVTAGGLDGAVLKSLPVFIYSPESDVDVPECAVCLSEFEYGETGRVLPKCKHCFHTECIDMWFGSHSTCPLCRSPVEAVKTEIPILVEKHETTTTSFSEMRISIENNETTSSFSDRAKRTEMPILVEKNETTTTPFSEMRIFVENNETTSFSDVGSSNTTTSFGDRAKGVDVRIEDPNWNELAAETELQLTSPSQGFRSPGSRLLSRIMNIRKSSGSGVGRVGTEFDIESGHESSQP